MSKIMQNNFSSDKSKNIDQLSAALIGLVLLLIIVPIINAFAIKQAWSMVMIPIFNVMNISLSQAFVLSLFSGIFSHVKTNTKSEKKSEFEDKSFTYVYAKEIFTLVITRLVQLGLIWLAVKVFL